MENIVHNIFDTLSQTVIITFLVIMIMIIIEYINVKAGNKWIVLMKKRPHLQIFLAAAIGLIPGCVGTFALVSMYCHRMIGFGSLLAALIASFGDEAFFMISLMPAQTLLLSGILFVIAIITGFLVEKIPFFSRLQNKNQEKHFEIHGDDCFSHPSSETEKKLSWQRYLLIVLMLLFIVGIATQFLGHDHAVSDSFHISQTEHSCDSHSHSHSHAEDHSLSGENIMILIIAIIALIITLFSNNHFVESHLWNHVVKKHFVKTFLWVFVILIVFSFGIKYIENVFVGTSFTGILWLLFAILIGIIPQSGPHLIFVFLFLDGIIPFSVLLANSIVQEGHSGLPLIAESPKTFLWIKIIKIIIALLVGLVGLLTGI